ncbi:MAG TPA: hypothetical protein VFI23_08995 [Rhizomicrobium sp.]|nr:hypothetical protein [Rhizomicrobium sp.]
MSISSVSSSTPQYQVPTTPQAKANDERTESQSARNQEAETGKEKAVAVQSANVVDVKA